MKKVDNKFSISGESRSSSSQTSNMLPKHSTKLKWFLASDNTTTNNLGNSQNGQTVTTISNTPQIKNHTATLYKKKLYVFGGYDGKKNHSNLRIFDVETLHWIKTKKPGGPQPLGRNGHTATLVGKRNKFVFMSQI